MTPLGVRDILILLLIAFTWGSNNVAAKVATTMVDPLVAAGLRFALSAAVMLPFLPAARRDLKILMGIALISGPIHFGILYTGFAFSQNIGAITVVLQLWVPLSTVIAAIVLHEYPSRSQVMGLVIALVGILIMCGDSHLIKEWRAVVLCFGASLAWALSIVLVRKAGRLSGLTVQAWLALVAAPCLLMMGGARNPETLTSIVHLPVSFWLLTAYSIAAAGILGNVLMFNMARRHPIAQTTPVLLTAPVFALLCGMVFLNERVALQECIGGLLTLAGVFVTARHTPPVPSTR